MSEDEVKSKMKSPKSTKFLNIKVWRFVFIGVGLGVFFWISESFIHAYLFDEGTFVQQLMHPAINEIWMRLLVAILLIGFGFYIQSTFGHNIIECKQAEKELRQGRERYAMAQKAANIGSWHWNMQTDELHWSEQVEPMFGFKPGEFAKTNEAFLKCIHPDDLQSVTDSVDAAVETNGKYDIEHRIVWPDGTIRWVAETGEIAQDEDGKNTHMLGIVQDVTKRKRAEKELHKSREVYRQLFTEMTSGFALHEIICDDEGRPCDYRFLEVNPAFEKLTGLKAEKIVGKTVLDVIPEIEPEWIEKYGKVALSGESIHFENYSNALNKHYEVTAYCPQPNRFAVIFHDVTNRKLAGQKEKQRQAEISHAGRLNIMGQMASELAHELNQPLCAILTHAEGSLRTIQSAMPDNDKVISKLETVVKQAGKIVSRVKNFSMKTEAVHSTIYVNDIVTEAVEFMSGELSRNSVRVKLALGDGMAAILGDLVQIEQVILNLMQNGIDAMIELPDSHRELKITTKTIDKSVEVAISDSGTGIEQEHSKSVFEPFFTTKPNGLGVGLSISRSIVESHGGNLGFRTNGDRGVTFYFNLTTNS